MVDKEVAMKRWPATQRYKEMARTVRSDATKEASVVSSGHREDGILMVETVEMWPL